MVLVVQVVSLKAWSNRPVLPGLLGPSSPSFCQWRIILSPAPGSRAPTLATKLNTMQYSRQNTKYEIQNTAGRQSSQNDTLMVERPNTRPGITSAPVLGTAYDFVEKLIFSAEKRMVFSRSG